MHNGQPYGLTLGTLTIAIWATSGHTNRFILADLGTLTTGNTNYTSGHFF